jgi:hypothetical protein
VHDVLELGMTSHRSQLFFNCTGMANRRTGKDGGSSGLPSKAIWQDWGAVKLPIPPLDRNRTF